MADPLTTTTPPGEPRVVDAGRGLAWWTEAWTLFLRQPGIWIVQGLVLLVLFVVLGLIPLIGVVATSLLMPVLTGGWLATARKADAGGTVGIADPFDVFKGDRVVPLVIVGVLLLGMTLAVMLITGVLGVGSVVGVIAGGANRSAGGIAAGLGMGLLAVLAGLLLGLLLTMALWFAIPLVALGGVAPVAALRLSFAACVRNLVPFIVYGLIAFVASIVAAIPFGLGWIVLMPVAALSVYVSYKDVFAGV